MRSAMTASGFSTPICSPAPHNKAAFSSEPRPTSGSTTLRATGTSTAHPATGIFYPEPTMRPCVPFPPLPIKAHLALLAHGLVHPPTPERSLPLLQGRLRLRQRHRAAPGGRQMRERDRPPEAERLREGGGPEQLDHRPVAHARWPVSAIDLLGLRKVLERRKLRMVRVSPSGKSYRAERESSYCPISSGHSPRGTGDSLLDTHSVHSRAQGTGDRTFSSECHLPQADFQHLDFAVESSLDGRCA